MFLLYMYIICSTQFCRYLIIHYLLGSSIYYFRELTGHRALESRKDQHSQYQVFMDMDWEVENQDCQALLDSRDQLDHQGLRAFEDQADHLGQKGRGVMQRLVLLNSDGKNNNQEFG